MSANVLLRMARESPAIRDLLVSYTQMSRESAASAAKADPQKHKLTRVMEPGSNTNYRYFTAGKDGRGRTVSFCWTCHRNAAGYFIGFRQVTGKAETKRDQFVARKTKTQCENVARRRQNAWIDKAAPP